MWCSVALPLPKEKGKIETSPIAGYADIITHWLHQHRSTLDTCQNPCQEKVFIFINLFLVEQLGNPETGWMKTWRLEWIRVFFQMHFRLPLPTSETSPWELLLTRLDKSSPFLPRLLGLCPVPNKKPSLHQWFIYLSHLLWWHRGQGWWTVQVTPARGACNAMGRICHIHWSLINHHVVPLMCCFLE